jgi:hypothetical protein
MSESEVTVKYAPFKEIIIMELIETGKVYWTFIGYSHMPKYAPTIETKEKLIVPVIDISSDPILRKVVQWLKKQK